MTGSDGAGTVFFASVFAVCALELRRVWSMSAAELEETGSSKRLAGLP